MRKGMVISLIALTLAITIIIAAGEKAFFIDNSSDEHVISLYENGSLYAIDSFFDNTTSDYYCNSTSCYTVDEFLVDTTGGVITQINLTSGTHNGDIENGTELGYEAGDSICYSEFTDSHFCNEFEVALYQGDDIDGEDAWIIAGSPKYIPATVPVNDCQGWTYSGTTTALGNYWHFNSTGKGEGRAINCGTTLKLACCSY